MFRDHGFDPEYRQFIEGNQKVVLPNTPKILPGLNLDQAERMTKLSTLPAFKSIYNFVDASGGEVRVTTIKLNLFLFSVENFLQGK